jgi:CHAT domain-containing protein
LCQSIRILETELARDILSIDVERRFRASGWHDVVEQLPEEAVLLEFFQLKSYDFTSVQALEKSSQIAQKYLAVVIAKRKDQPEIVHLGEAQEIDILITEFRAEITGQVDLDMRKGEVEQVNSTRKLSLVTSYGRSTGESGERLRRLIFDPLVDRIGQSTRIIISPDGNLFRLPFEILPLANGNRLIDQYEISYLTSGNDLLRLSTKPPINLSRPLVIADPDFDLAGVAAIDVPSTASLVPFSRLGGTRAEGKTVSQMLGVEMFSGTEAVEGVVKSSSSPAILHLATHGFVLKYQSQYLAPQDIKVGMTVRLDNPTLAIRTPEELLGDSARDPETESFIVVTPPQMVESDSVSEFSRLSGKGLNNPMLRSGIALAGANSWLRGQQLPDKTEDGILTAEEVSDLNLVGTELVVLSACETGLGEILSGEGVFGFRRSFVLAGARSLVISLWKVPDIQTKELMIEFYTRLIAGEARSQALRNAQLVIKEKYPNPYYWGAFICQGDFFPMTNTFTQLQGGDTSCQ